MKKISTNFKLNHLKKAVLSALAIFAVLSSNAQREGLWVSPQASIGGGSINGFPGANGLSGNFSGLYGLSNFSGMFGIGADVCYMFTNHLGVGSGIALSTYGTSFTQLDASNNNQNTMSQSTFDIPLYLRFVTGSGGGGFFVHVGFVNSFLSSASESFVASTPSGSDAKKDFSGYTISPFLYFGGNIKCGNSVQMTLGPFVQGQANNNFSNSSNLDGHYLIFGVKIGVGIKLLSRASSSQY